MKEKLIAVVLLLILTASLPIAVSKCSERSFAKPTVSTSDTPEKPKDSGEILCALTAGLYKDSYSAETLKAIAILMNTNYKANPDSFKANDFLYEENTSGSIKDVYGEIKKAADSAKNKNAPQKQRSVVCSLFRNFKRYYIQKRKLQVYSQRCISVGLLPNRF